MTINHNNNPWQSMTMHVKDNAEFIEKLVELLNSLTTEEIKICLIVTVGTDTRTGDRVMFQSKTMLEMFIKGVSMAARNQRQLDTQKKYI